MEKEDVNEAMRLMEMSKDSLKVSETAGGSRAASVTDRIYAVIRDLAKDVKGNSLKYADVRQRCVDRGFKPDQIEEAIEEYEQLNVFSVNQTKTKITFTDVV